MMDLLEYGIRFENLVFQKDNIEEPCLMVYGRDRQKKDEERWVVNYLNTDQVKELAEYLKLYLNRIEP